MKDRRCQKKKKKMKLAYDGVEKKQSNTVAVKNAKEKGKLQSTSFQ